MKVTSGSFLTGFLISISLVIGPGLFSVPSMAVESGSSASVLAWLLTSIAIAPFLYVFYCLGKRTERVTGMADWVREAFGDWMGDSVSLLQLMALLCLIPVLAGAAAAYLTEFTGLHASYRTLVTWAILLVAVLPSVCSPRFRGLISRLSFAALIVFLGALLYVHHDFALGGLISTTQSISHNGLPAFSSVWEISVLIFFTFVGWENYSSAAMGDKVTGKTLSAIYFLSYLFVVVLYVAFALLIVGAKEGGLAVQGISGLSSLIDQMPMGNLFKALVILVCISNCGTWMSGSLRLVRSSANNPVLPLMLSRYGRTDLSLVFLLGIPSAVVLLQASMGLTVSSLIQFANQNFLVLYGLILLAYFRLAGKGVVRWVMLAMMTIPASLLVTGASWSVAICALPLLVGFVKHRMAVAHSQPNILPKMDWPDAIVSPSLHAMVGG